MFRSKEAEGLRVFNTIFYVLMVGVTAYLELLPLNNVTAVQISERHMNSLTLPTFSFGAWFVILFWLLLFVLYQNGLFLKRGEGDNPDLIHAISIFFIISSIASVCWFTILHYDYITLAFLIIFVMWSALLFLNSRLRTEILSRKDVIFARIPFSMYLSWVTFIMATNFAAMFKQLDPGLLGISPATWTMSAIGALFLFTEYFVIRHKDYAFGITSLWAFGSMLYRYATDIITDESHTGILMLIALATGILLISLLVVSWVQRNKSNMT